VKQEHRHTKPYRGDQTEELKKRIRQFQNGHGCSVRDQEALEREVLSAATSRDGIRLGNVCHKLRCRYGYRFNTLQILSGLPAEDFDALVRQWDDADVDFAGLGKELGF